MRSVCCGEEVFMEEGNEALYMVCSGCGRPCDRVVNKILLEALKDEQLRTGVGLCFGA